MKCLFLILTGLSVSALFFCRTVCAAETTSDAGVLAEKAGIPGSGEPIDVTADRLEYDESAGWVKATGNAVIRRGGETLTAERIRVNTRTGQAYAEGNVKLVDSEGGVWRGSKLSHNFKSRVGEVSGLTLKMTPFRLLASSSAKRESSSAVVINDPVVTTCTNAPDHVHYRIKARNLTFVPDEYLKVRHAVWYFGNIPVMYLPYWKQNVNDRGLRMSAGYTSDLGGFLLLSHRFRLSENLESEPHLDYYSSRGIGIGEGLKWRNQDRYDGEFFGYYIHDLEPDQENNPDIDNNRYSLKIRHRYKPGPSDYAMGQLEYWSDRAVLEDFFESDYKRHSQPENYLWYSYRGDGYLASVIARFRLNDFYSSVNRMPEASVDIFERKLGDTSFYYKSRNSAVSLEKLHEELSSADDYSAFRFDSENRVLHSGKWFGFLNFIPRASYRATYYSKTRDSFSEVTGSGTNEAVSSVETEEGPELRHVFELGQKTSFKAFKMFRSNKMRHVVEPYTDYTYIPEPNISPVNIYQFDGVDALDSRHDLRIGMRNKLQSKQGNRPFDFVDIDGYTVYMIERDQGEAALKYFWFDTEIMPNERSSIEFDGRWDLEDSQLDSFNTRMNLRSQDNIWHASAEYRYIQDSRSILSGIFTLWPQQSWTLETEWRYRLMDSRIEEQWLYAQRNLDCMSIRSGLGVRPGHTTESGAEREDEWRVIFEFWLTAFPEASLSSVHGN